MKTKLAEIAANLALLNAFEEKYGDKLPEEIVTLSASYGASLSIATGYGNVQDRNKVLGLVGHALGRDGWTRKRASYSGGFDWSITIDGVKVTVSNAESMPPMESSPVPPQMFPLLLEEA